MRRQFAEAQQGRGSFALLSGEAGIGKTTLVEDLARYAEEQGALVLWGHAYDLSITPPYGPWIAMLGLHEGGDGLPDPPAFIQNPLALRELQSQTALFQQVADFLGAVADGRPLLLILEDLQWADDASLELLRFVARQLPETRLMLVATYRNDEPTQPLLHTLVPLLVRESQGQRINLRPLVDADVGALVSSRYALPQDDHERLVHYLHQHAEGNPLFIGELLRSFEHEHRLTETGRGWSVGRLNGLHVPLLLSQIIERRLRYLAPTTVGDLQVGAVIGQVVPLDLWAAVTGADDERLARAMEESLAAGLIVELPESHAWRFKHALFREALYQLLVLPRRRYWHRRIAEALERRPQPDPDAVAYHFQQASDRRAVDWLIRAGERAEEARALRAAGERFVLVVNLLEHDPERAAERAWLLYRVARNLRFAAPERSNTYLAQAIEAAEQVGDRVLQARARWELGLQHCNAGHYRRGLSEMLAADASASRPSTDPVEDRQPALEAIDRKLGTLVLMFAHAGRYAEAVALGERYLAAVHGVLSFEDLLQHARDGWTSWADACFGLGLARSALGDVEGARELLSSARQGYVVARHHALESLVLAHELQEVALPYLTDHPAERRRLALAAEAAASRAGSGAFGLDTSLHAAGLAAMLLEGDWAEARRVGLQELAAPTLFQEPAHLTLARLACRQGDTRLAWEQIGVYLPDGPETDPGDSPYFFALGLQQTAVALALDAGDLASAASWLDAHDRWLDWSTARRGRAGAALLRARLDHARGDLDGARTRVERALSCAAQPRQPLVLFAAHRFLGRLDTDERRFSHAEEHLQQSLHLAETCQAPFERSLTLLSLSELRAAQEKLDEARRLLATVRAICEPLEAMPTLERVAELEARLTAKPKPRHAAGLSEREVEVLRLVSQGLTDAEVAERLYLSPRTVSQHLRSVYNKLGVNSRTAATRFAVERGLI